jgi:hypothetical protein
MRGSFAHVEGVQGATHSAQITVEFWTTSACKRPQGSRQMLLQHPNRNNFAQVWISMCCWKRCHVAPDRQRMLTGQACSRAGMGVPLLRAANAQRRCTAKQIYHVSVSAEIYSADTVWHSDSLRVTVYWGTRHSDDQGAGYVPQPGAHRQYLRHLQVATSLASCKCQPPCKVHFDPAQSCSCRCCR